MLHSALVIVAAGSAVAQTTYPDQLDILRAADTTPQIELLLDTSGSMGTQNPALDTTCSWYYNNETTYAPDPDYPLLRLEMLKAVLIGCETGTDGIIDKWGDQVVFAIREFGGGRTNIRADFVTSNQPVDADGIPTGTDVIAAKLAVRNLFAEGGTPLTRAYRAAAEHFGNVLSDRNSRHCRQNFIVLMTDGVGNANNRFNPVTFNFIPANPAMQVADTNYFYPAGDGYQYTPPFSDQAAQYLVRDSGGNIVDALPNVSDTVLPGGGGTRGQPIRTYTIAFDAPGVATTFLRDMAYAGEGEPHTATSYEQLDNAFENIISSIIPRSQVAFSPGTVQNQGFFSGNYMYRATFQPAESGHWFGTVKKHCVLPASPTDTTCLFQENAGDLYGNPAVVDLWTNSALPEATAGGSGQQIMDALGAPNVPASPYSRRTIMTWRPGGSNYIRVDGSSSFTSEDTKTNGPCDHFRLLNKLHGYTDQVTDCTAGDYSPVDYDTWAEADTANGSTVLLRYTEDCESPASLCYVLTNTNNGMLHVFRGRDGAELSAVIPGELFHSPGVANHRLAEIMDQPNLEQMKRYYFDGGMRLFHEDRNANGYIDNGEVAYLVAGLGRGGRAYYLWDVSNFNGDFSSAAAPDPKPLMADEGTGLKNLRDTWATPWLGLLRNNGNIRRVAVFGSGHMRELDRPDAAFARLEAAEPPVPTDTESSPYTQSCTALGVDPALCSPPFSRPCIACEFADPAACPTLQPSQTYCYDSPANNADPAMAPFNDNQGTGYNLLFGPFAWASGNQSAEAYRVIFSEFELQPGDFIEFLDANQRVLAQLSESGTGSASPCGGAACTPWMYTSSIYVRFVSNGLDDADVRGWSVGNVEMLRRNNPPEARIVPPTGAPPAPTGSNFTRPTVFIADLDRWANLPSFNARPVGGDTVQRDAIFARFTSDCEGLTGSNELCFDATGSGGQTPQPDLADMTCPITAEPAVYDEGGVFAAAYVGTECGQIFKIVNEPNGEWKATRLIHLNRADASGRIVADGRSEDYRKIFTRPELVLSRCNGGRSLGVYFGTGNIQLPSSETTLSDVNVTRFAGTGLGAYDGDVFGVVWDSNLLPTPSDGLNLDDLQRLNGGLIEIADPTTGPAANGWYLELGTQGVKVLRDPVVFDGVASFKVYSPESSPTECVSGTGLDVVYQMDNCNAAPIVDTFDPGDVVGDNTTDRITYRGRTDIGSGLLLFTPNNGDSFLSAGDSSASVRGKLAGNEDRRSMNVFLWRTFVDGF